MRHRKTRVLALLGVAVLLACAAVAHWGAGPEPAGTRAPAAPDPASWRAAFASADPASIEQARAQILAQDPAPVGVLLAFLAEADRGVREWAAHALGDLAPQDAEVVAALMRAFDDPDDWVRWKAARALGCIGPPSALRALPLLEVAAQAQQETEVVRAAAQVAVARLRGD